MRRLIGASLLLAAFVILPGLELYAQKDKKKDEPAKEKPKVDSSKLKGEFVGNLKSVPGSDRIFVVEGEFPRLVPTGKANAKGTKGNNNANRIIQLQNQLLNDQRQLARARNAQQRNQAVQRIQQHTYQIRLALAQMQSAGAGGVPQGYRIEVARQDIEFQASDAVKVRTMLVGEEFDDKGNIKKHTKEELAAMKGKDKNLPGYESSLEKLEVGQKVKVTLGAAAKKAADKDTDKEETADAEKKMQVKLIVILAEASSNSTAPKGRGKKK